MAERNNLWLLFADERTRALLGDWADDELQLLGQFRAHLARFPNDPRGPELLETLRAAHPRFAELWEQHAVRSFRASRKRVGHPKAGQLDLDYLKLAMAADEQQYLVVYLPADAATAARLPLLR